MQEVFLVDMDGNHGFFDFTVGFKSNEDAEKCKEYLKTNSQKWKILTIRRHFVFDSFDSFIEKLKKHNLTFLQDDNS